MNKKKKTKKKQEDRMKNQDIKEKHKKRKVWWVGKESGVKKEENEVGRGGRA